MFNLKENQKSVFKKLYYYYCTKLLSKIGLVFVYFLLFIFFAIIQAIQLKKLFDQKLFDNPSWQHKIVTFWVISFIQLLALWMMMAPLVSYLVGRGLGWEEFKKRKFFQMPKISRQEDIKVLIFTPRVKRETVIQAKFATAFTYFMGINFLLTLFGFFFFLFFTKIGVITALLFLLINGIILTLVNFVLIVPWLFYAQEAGSFLFYFLFAFFIMFLPLIFYLLRDSIVQYPVILYLISVPFYTLTGYFLFSLYWNKFLENDLI